MKNTLLSFIQEYSRDFIGIPYEEMDCYQLVVNFFKVVYGLDFNVYEYKDPLDKKEIKCHIDLGRNESCFKLVKKPNFADIVLMNLEGYPVHLGIYLGDNRVLHTKLNTGSIIDRLERVRVEGFYQWQNLDLIR